MSTTAMLTGDSNTVKLWSRQGIVDIIKSTSFGRMLSAGTIMVASELDNAGVGDQITISYTGLLQGLGQTEGDTLVGNEEALNNEAFQMKINVTRHGVSSPNDNTIEQARTYIRFYDRARELLPRWHASRIDASVFNQLAGVDSTTITVDGAVYSGAKKTIVQGHNTISAPSTNRIIRAGGAANDQSLTSSDTFTLDLIDAAIELAARTYPQIEMLDGEKFDLYLSPEQITDLKRDTTGKITWYANYLSAMEGGMMKDNPIMVANQFSIKPVAEYAGVRIIPSYRVAYGQNGSTDAALPNVRRAVMVGKRALAYGSRFSGALQDFNKTDGKCPLIFETELKDYNYIKGLEARTIMGLKKLQFESEDLGVVVISTYAAAHTF